MPGRRFPQPVVLTSVNLRVTLDAHATPDEAERVGGLLIQHLINQGHCAGDTDVSVEAHDAGGERRIEVQNVPVDFSRPDGIEQVIECVRDFMAKQGGGTGKGRAKG